VKPGVKTNQRFNPYGVVAPFPISPGCTWGYSYSTPTGLWAPFPFPQVAPGAIHIQPLRGCGPLSHFPRFHLGLFIFNPYGVVAPFPISLQSRRPRWS